MKTVGSLGEWKWLAGLLPGLSRDLSRRVVLGPGDDAALVRAGRAWWAVTTDMLVEGVHFRRRWTSGVDLGFKALAVNLSDLAAMGDVRPLFGVVSAGLPPGTPVAYIKDFYRGFRALSRRHGFDLVGGDTVRADRLTVTVTAVGRVRRKDRIFRRETARPGDVLLVTGTLGDAAAGLRILERGRPVRSADERFLVRRFRRPTPRFDDARRLAAAGVRAGLDNSDGLWRSVRLLGEASGTGAEVHLERLPISAPLARWAGAKALNLALAGGEDYELIVAASPAVARRIVRRGWAVAVGEIPARRAAFTLFQNGRPREAPSGFEHFNA